MQYYHAVPGTSTATFVGNGKTKLHEPVCTQHLIADRGKTGKISSVSADATSDPIILILCPGRSEFHQRVEGSRDPGTTHAANAAKKFERGPGRAIYVQWLVITNSRRSQI